MLIGVVVILAGALILTAAGRGLIEAFLDSLRIARPSSVTVGVTAVAGPGTGRPLIDVVANMLGDSTQPMAGDSSRTVATPRAATEALGFAPQLPANRTDHPTLSVTAAPIVQLKVDRSRLGTLLAEAGEVDNVPPDLDGASVRMSGRRGLRAQYGHCPLPVPSTVQGQLQGPLPPSADNADCVILLETPTPTFDAPAALPTGELLGVALQLSGLSPEQVRVFQHQVDTTASLLVALPRFVRSSDTVRVGRNHGILLNTAGRRGPSYALVWTEPGMTYVLMGYGSAADALPLATSLRATP
ncbi:MAG TPA: hypothetical protein VJN62_02785 [Gemmatimonadales bacterium]|nr:hypothetical protein [Gemmatimonadales bacterium]